MQYGETYEHRPLIYAIVISRKFQQPRTNPSDNLKRTGILEAHLPEINGHRVMSYNVHEMSQFHGASMKRYRIVNPPI